jgi:hypothetical protein
MKKTTEKGKLLAMVTAAGKEKFGLASDTSDLTMDTPMILQFNVGKNEYYVCDETHKIPCKFTEKALFWLKLNNDNMSVDDLDKRYIFLTEYTFQTSLSGKSKVKVDLIIHGMSVIDKKEAKEYSYSLKKAEDVMANSKVVKALDSVCDAHQHNTLSKRCNPDKLPDLEGIITNKRSKAPKSKSTAKHSEEMIIGFKEMGKAEKEIKNDVKILLDNETKIKDKVKAGSEGNLERDIHLSKVAEKMKNERLMEYLKDHGTIDRKRDPAKSPVKRGRMPRDMLATVEEIKKLAAGKRKKPEGSRSRSAKPKKRVAVDGKKAAPVKQSKSKKTSRSTSRKRVK